jgi:hypothetical protein
MKTATGALVIGESHTNAVSQAIIDEAAGYEGVVVHRLASRRAADDHASTMEHAIGLVRNLPTETPLFLSILGTFHNIIGLMRTGADYDFMVDEHDKTAEGTQIVRLPHRALAAVFRDHFNSTGAVRRICAAAKSPVYLLSSPPPKQSNDFITQKFMRKQARAYRGQSIMDAGLSPPELRMKLWKLEAKLLGQWAEEQGMSFVPAPPEAFNEDGFLSRKFYHEDATHANGRYGALVLEQIAARAARFVDHEEVVNG